MGLGPIMSWCIMLAMILSIIGHCTDTAMRMAGYNSENPTTLSCYEYDTCGPQPPPDPY